MKLSPNFTLEEMTVSETAVRKGIDNTPNAGQMENLRQLCKYILEPLRILVGAPILVTSGYRSPALNKTIGGAKTSQHCLGLSADIHTNKYSIDKLYQLIKKSRLPYDQVIHEFGQWVHVSYAYKTRHECLIATKVKGKTIYTNDNI